MEDRKQKVGKGRETERKDTKKMVKGGNGKKRHKIKGKERWGRKRKGGEGKERKGREQKKSKNMEGNGKKEGHERK